MIFGNNSGQLSYYNDAPKPDDLKELQILTVTGSDGVFNEGDYLLFSPMALADGYIIKPPGSMSIYTIIILILHFYFITSGPVPGKQIPVAVKPSLPVTFISSESDALFEYEQDIENLIKSGREWFQEISSIHIDPVLQTWLLLKALNITSGLLQGLRLQLFSVFTRDPLSKKTFRSTELICLILRAHIFRLPTQLVRYSHHRHLLYLISGF